MNLRVNSTLTAAEKTLIDQFAKARENLPGNGEAWMDNARTSAIRSFEKNGLPHRRLERWKYTDLRAMLGQIPAPATGIQVPALPAQTDIDAHTVFASVERYHGVFVNGYFQSRLSGFEDIEGVEIVNLRDSFSNFPEWVKAKLSNTSGFEANAVLALNTAFAADGIALRIKAGATIEKPIHLDYVTIGDEAAAISVRNLILVEKGAQATMVETFTGPQEVAYVVNAATQVVVEDDAMLTRIKVQDEGLKAFHLANMQINVGHNTRCHDLTLTLGAGVSRNEVNIGFSGENADVTIAGASMLAGKQHGDTTLCMTHSLPSCNSRQEFKTVLDDYARGIFQGCVIVKPHAQKTDGRQMTQALLLSPNAEMDAKPELEIYADDVECAHGATAGDLDDDYLFYLRARGIPEAEAKALLVAAFVAEPLEKIEHEGLREGLFQLTNAWFDRRKERS